MGSILRNHVQELPDDKIDKEIQEKVKGFLPYTNAEMDSHFKCPNWAIELYHQKYVLRNIDSAVRSINAGYQGKGDKHA